MSQDVPLSGFQINSSTSVFKNVFLVYVECRSAIAVVKQCPNVEISIFQKLNLPEPCY
jgi:hypothetical protein